VPIEAGSAIGMFPEQDDRVRSSRPPDLLTS